MENTSAAYPHGSDYWAEHCLCPVSYYRHFSQIRSQDRLYLEFLPERRWLVALTMIVFLKYVGHFSSYTLSSGSIYRFVDIDGIYSSDVKERSIIWHPFW